VSSYLGAPGSSPAERMSKDAELELGVPSGGNDAVSKSEVFGGRYQGRNSTFPARKRRGCQDWFVD